MERLSYQAGDALDLPTFDGSVNSTLLTVTVAKKEGIKEEKSLYAKLSEGQYDMPILDGIFFASPASEEAECNMSRLPEEYRIFQFLDENSVHPVNLAAFL